MTARIIKISGCHCCNYPELLEYTLKMNPRYLCGHPSRSFIITKYYNNKTIHPDCRLDKEVTLKDLAIEDAGKLAEHIRDCARRDAVKHIRAAIDRHPDTLHKVGQPPFKHELIEAILASLKQVEG